MTDNKTTFEEIEKQQQQIKDQILDLEKKQKELEALKRIAEKEKKLDKYPSEFPPGFTFYWYHRLDPFDSYYRLQFEWENVERTWDCGDHRDSKLKAREIAWSFFDQSVAICKASGLIK
jgi:hypothetical protein